MRAVVQRVSEAWVTVDGREVGRCGHGLALMVAAHRDDTETTARKLAAKVAGLRIFNDGEGKMNLALADLEPTGEPQVLAISNFTVYGDASNQRRPSFMAAAAFERGRELFAEFVRQLGSLGLRTAEGEFGADMKVGLINDGPVTLIVEVPPDGKA